MFSQLVKHSPNGFVFEKTDEKHRGISGKEENGK